MSAAEAQQLSDDWNEDLEVSCINFPFRIFAHFPVMYLSI